MADLMGFSVTKVGTVQATIPVVTISCTVVDSADQSKVLADFTGANAISFPTVWKTLSADEKDEFADMVADWLIRTKAGL